MVGWPGPRVGDMSSSICMSLLIGNSLKCVFSECIQ